MAMLTRVRGESDLRSWALALRKWLGFKRAAVALARKLAVIMHAMLKTGTDFNPKPSAEAHPCKPQPKGCCAEADHELTEKFPCSVRPQDVRDVPAGDVGEAIPLVRLRPSWTAQPTLESRPLECPSCGGPVSTA